MVDKSDPYHPYVSLYTNPTGAGDARPSITTILEDDHLIGALKGKVFLVTGASSGIGVETARALVRTGASVWLGARDVKKGEEVAQDLSGENDRAGEIRVLQMDLSSLKSVRRAAEEMLGACDRLDGLVNNAGIMAVQERTLNEDGQELQFATNHLGHFLLTKLLIPLLLKTATPESPARIVAVSSIGHRNGTPDFSDLSFATKPYTPFGAYGASKTANIWMTNELHRRYAQSNIVALSLNPGGISTGLQKHIPAERVAEWSKNPEFQKLAMSVEQGAATSVWAAVGKVFGRPGEGGKYLEECGVSFEIESNEKTPRSGYGKHAFDEEQARKLWEVSCGLVGVEDETM